MPGTRAGLPVYIPHLAHQKDSASNRPVACRISSQISSYLKNTLPRNYEWYLGASVSQEIPCEDSMRRPTPGRDQLPPLSAAPAACPCTSRRLALARSNTGG